MGAAAAASAASGYSSPMNGIDWTRFDATNGCVMFNKGKNNSNKGPSPCHVRQGRVGNCWFLSALAVVAERQDLIHQIVPQHELNDKGCYQINLCLDGKWTPIIVDCNLPVIVEEMAAVGTAQQQRIRGASKRKRDKLQDGVPLPNAPHLVAFAAFAATPSRQLWPALVEKAYAKAHGSYAHLSGGFIAEAFADLTGAPTETIPLYKDAASNDELWVRLLSFSQAGFLMGVATAKGGDGLVGRHAYSILDVVEINNSVVGEQCKVTEFFAMKPSKSASAGNDGEAPAASAPAASCSGSQLLSPTASRKRGERTTIRLVRIRDPWGIREWKGAWSADSEQWTIALRKRLKDSWSKGDGTFFMSFEDMLERFHHLDVAKARKVRTSFS
jgi:hypothetical protein